MNTKCLIILFATVLSGCEIINSQNKYGKSNNSICAEDWRDGNDICEIHQCKMKTINRVKPRTDIRYFNDRAYIEAKLKYFPNCQSRFSPGGNTDETIKIYVCERCCQLDNEWRTSGKPTLLFEKPESKYKAESDDQHTKTQANIIKPIDTSVIEDWRDKCEICSIHQCKMNTIIRPKPNPDIHIDYIPGYLEALYKLFPNCDSMNYFAEKTNSLIMIYVCKRCQDAEKQWLDSDESAKAWTEFYAPQKSVRWVK